MASQTAPSKTAVIIIGAGPTGLSMATQLLRYNIEFVILEKNEKTTPFSKAVVVQARTLEIFKEIGLAEKALEQGRLTTAMNLFYKGKKRAAVNVAGLGKGLSAFPFALSLEQSKTEKLLADQLLANHKTIYWQCTFISLEQHANGVVVHYTDAEGVRQVVEGAYLVGCDGAHSPVRHQLQLNFEGDTVPKIFYVTDVTLSSNVINKDELFIFLVKKGFVLFFPMEGNAHYRIVGILPDKTSGDVITFDDVDNFIQDQLEIPVKFEEVRWFSTYKVHSRKADNFMKDRCFIAGDAAHIHTPAGGQGMNTGIQDAYNLAWKLAGVLNKNIVPEMLDTYNTERTANASHLLHTTDRMFDIMAGSNLFWNFIRLKIFPSLVNFFIKRSFLNKAVFPLLSQIGIGYPGSALTIKSTVGKVKAGSRMPFFTLPDGSNIFDHLTTPGFKLLFFGLDNGSSFDNFGHHRLITHTAIFNDIPTELFKGATGFYILLRPDNHIAYIGKNAATGMQLLQQISTGK